MKILLTGAGGYIGSRLMPVLIEAGHEIVALTRSRTRLSTPEGIQIIEADLLDPNSLNTLPKDIDIAYYLVHSMGDQSQGFSSKEAESARNFSKALEQTNAQQIIYLSGLAHGKELSEHMQSRKAVGEILQKSIIPTTILEAGIIIGSGSASFEIIRDLIEKLPVMVAPKWVRSLCQPIAVADVIFYLCAAAGNEACKNKSFDIGGPEQMSYLEMLRRFAKMRQLHRLIIPIPLLTPRLSSYWLFFVTSTSYSLAKALVESLKHDAICEDFSIGTIIPHKCLTYDESLSRAFERIEQHVVVSSWKDAVVKSNLNPDLQSYIAMPTHGCLKESITLPYVNRTASIKKLWAIGGNNGWYYMDWAWRFRGYIDRMVGGIGLRRGRTHPTRLRNGDVLDFWRVLLAEPDKGVLLLYTEMKIPGEAWLEYRIENGTVTQTATFRPKGLFGRLYWYSLVPIHYFIFRGLCSAIATAHLPSATPSHVSESHGP